MLKCLPKLHYISFGLLMAVTVFPLWAQQPSGGYGQGQEPPAGAPPGSQAPQTLPPSQAQGSGLSSSPGPGTTGAGPSGAGPTNEPPGQNPSNGNLNNSNPPSTGAGVVIGGANNGVVQNNAPGPTATRGQEAEAMANADLAEARARQILMQARMEYLERRLAQREKSETSADRVREANQKARTAVAKYREEIERYRTARQKELATRGPAIREAEAIARRAMVEAEAALREANAQQANAIARAREQRERTDLRGLDNVGKCSITPDDVRANNFLKSGQGIKALAALRNSINSPASASASAVGNDVCLVYYVDQRNNSELFYQIRAGISFSAATQGTGGISAMLDVPPELRNYPDLRNYLNQIDGQLQSFYSTNPLNNGAKERRLGYVQAALVKANELLSYLNDPSRQGPSHPALVILQDWISSMSGFENLAQPTKTCSQARIAEDVRKACHQLIHPRIADRNNLSSLVGAKGALICPEELPNGFANGAPACPTGSNFTPDSFSLYQDICAARGQITNCKGENDVAPPEDYNPPRGPDSGNPGVESQYDEPRRGYPSAAQTAAQREQTERPRSSGSMSK